MVSIVSVWASELTFLGTTWIPRFQILSKCLELSFLQWKIILKDWGQINGSYHNKETHSTCCITVYAVLFEITQHSRGKKGLSLHQWTYHWPEWVGACSGPIAVAANSQSDYAGLIVSGLECTGTENISSKFCVSERYYWQFCSESVLSVSNWRVCAFPPEPIWKIETFMLFCSSVKDREENGCIEWLAQRCKAMKKNCKG